MYTLEQGTEPPTAPRALQHKWLPTALGVCSRCVCVHGVCVHFGWVRCRAQVPRMGHHTWLYVTPLSLSLSLDQWWSVRHKCYEINGSPSEIARHIHKQ